MLAQTSINQTSVVSLKSVKVFLAGVLNGQFCTESHRIQIEDSFMGFNDNAQIDAWVERNAPGLTVLDWQFA
jgi:hypothetical protein